MIISSYAIEIKHIQKLFKATLKVYNAAINYCVKTVINDYDDFKNLKTTEQKKSYIEHLIHTPKNNEAKYKEYDIKFQNMPVYMTRSVVAKSLGHIESYKTNFYNWEKNGKKGNEPKLCKITNDFPTFYRDGLYKEEDIDKDRVKLKIYNGKTWDWVEVRLKHTDLQYIRHHCADKIMSCPTLCKKNKKWFLTFTFEELTEKIKEVNIYERKIMAVDLGLNTDAVCSVMVSNGTILARKFIKFASDKDLLTHKLNQLKGIQQRFNNDKHQMKKLWRFINNLNEQLAIKIARAIIDVALLYKVDVIVFEYLDFKGHKTKNQLISLWKKKFIQKMVEFKAHQNKMRISRICAWGTSKLAFDGSGEVLRGKKAGFTTQKLCKFSNGKKYNSDLSASYNIGARYFIRELQKSILATEWSGLTAKVPELQKRTKCTYATLLELNKARMVA